MSMSSNRPYLIRAFYEWIVDNECTPYVVVDAYFPGVEVPQQYVNDGQIVLNLAPRAISALELGNGDISFNTRFGGVPTDIHLPVDAVLGIYARENGQGMVFQSEEPLEATLTSVKSMTVIDDDNDADGGDGDDTPPPTGGKSAGRPTLRVVK